MNDPSLAEGNGWASMPKKEPVESRAEFLRKEENIKSYQTPHEKYLSKKSEKSNSPVIIGLISLVGWLSILFGPLSFVLSGARVNFPGIAASIVGGMLLIGLSLGLKLLWQISEDLKSRK